MQQVRLCYRSGTAGSRQTLYVFSRHAEAFLSAQNEVMGAILQCDSNRKSDSVSRRV